MQKIYNAGEPQVWSAVIQTLPQMGFFIESMDMNLGVIRATDDIRRDAYSFLSGTVYWMDIRIRSLSPGITMVSIEYPEIPGLLYERTIFDPEADIFYNIQSHMGK